jgi:hypothetical protein
LDDQHDAAQIDRLTELDGCHFTRCDAPIGNTRAIRAREILDRDSVADVQTQMSAGDAWVIDADVRLLGATDHDLTASRERVGGEERSAYNAQ